MNRGRCKSWSTQYRVKGYKNNLRQGPYVYNLIAEMSAGIIAFVGSVIQAYVFKGLCNAGSQDIE